VAGVGDGQQQRHPGQYGDPEAGPPALAPGGPAPLQGEESQVRKLISVQTITETANRCLETQMFTQIYAASSAFSPHALPTERR